MEPNNNPVQFTTLRAMDIIDGKYDYDTVIYNGIQYCVAKSLNPSQYIGKKIRIVSSSKGFIIEEVQEKH
jgi:hypothetical protein